MELEVWKFQLQSQLCMHAACMPAFKKKKKKIMCVMSYRLHSAVRGSTELVKIENVESLKSEKEEKEEV